MLNVQMPAFDFLLKRAAQCDRMGFMFTYRPCICQPSACCMSADISFSHCGVFNHRKGGMHGPHSISVGAVEFVTCLCCVYSNFLDKKKRKSNFQKGFSDNVVHGENATSRLEWNVPFSGVNWVAHLVVVNT